MSENNKPKFLTVRYTVSNTLNITDLEQEYGFKWEDVKHWWVKWDELNIILNGSEKEGERHLVISIDSYECEMDTKRPDSCTVFDEHFKPVIRVN